MAFPPVLMSLRLPASDFLMLFAAADILMSLILPASALALVPILVMVPTPAAVSVLVTIPTTPALVLILVPASPASSVLIPTSPAFSVAFPSPAAISVAAAAPIGTSSAYIIIFFDLRSQVAYLEFEHSCGQIQSITVLFLQLALQKALHQLHILALMSLPGTVQVDIRLGLHHLSRPRKFLLLYGGMTEALYLANPEQLPIAGKGKRPSRLARASRPADTMHIILGVLRKIIIDNDLHIVHVDASCRHIRSNQNIGGSVPETAHGYIPLVLGHIPVQPLHLKSGLSHHLCKLVHLDLCIAEDQAESGLIILQQPDARRILILLLHSIISLGNQRYGQLLCRHLYQSGILLKFIGYFQNRLGHGGREQRGLVRIGNLAQNQLHILPKAHVQHLVRLVQNYHVHIVQLHSPPAHVVHDAPRSSHNDLHTLQAIDLSGNVLPAIYGKHLNAMHILGDLAQLLRSLHGQLSGRAENNRLQLLQIRINLLQGRDSECRGLAGSCLGLSDNIVTVQKVGDCHLLNRTKLHEAHLPDGPHDPLIKKGLDERQTVRAAHRLLPLFGIPRLLLSFLAPALLI